LENDTELAKHIVENTFRYVSLFEDAIQESLPETQVRVIGFKLILA
jgi:DNA replicative helicase MCM subunit Mcm2 (Cdc46/Mcm family)